MKYNSQGCIFLPATSDERLFRWWCPSPRRDLSGWWADTQTLVCDHLLNWMLDDRGEPQIIRMMFRTGNPLFSLFFFFSSSTIQLLPERLLKCFWPNTISWTEETASQALLMIFQGLTSGKQLTNYKHCLHIYCHQYYLKYYIDRVDYLRLELKVLVSTLHLNLQKISSTSGSAFHLHNPPFARKTFKCSWPNTKSWTEETASLLSS